MHKLYPIIPLTAINKKGIIGYNYIRGAVWNRLNF